MMTSEHGTAASAGENVPECIWEHVPNVNICVLPSCQAEH